MYPRGLKCFIPFDLVILNLVYPKEITRDVHNLFVVLFL